MGGRGVGKGGNGRRRATPIKSQALTTFFRPDGRINRAGRITILDWFNLHLLAILPTSAWVKGKGGGEQEEEEEEGGRGDLISS